VVDLGNKKGTHLSAFRFGLSFFKLTHNLPAHEVSIIIIVNIIDKKLSKHNFSVL
jgi:hypothetical protein